MSADEDREKLMRLFPALGEVKDRPSLRRWREARGLTCEKLASILGECPTVINKIERLMRQPSLDLAYRIEKLTNGQVPMSSWTGGMP